jgi:hypothetical protein
MGKTTEARVEWLKVKQLKPANAEDRRYVAEADKRLK